MEINSDQRPSESTNRLQEETTVETIAEVEDMETIAEVEDMEMEMTAADKSEMNQEAPGTEETMEEVEKADKIIIEVTTEDETSDLRV